jgi:hypothetical protein
VHRAEDGIANELREQDVHQRVQIAGLAEHGAQIPGARQAQWLCARGVEQDTADDAAKCEQTRQLDAVAIRQIDIEDASNERTSQGSRRRAPSHVPGANTPGDQAPLQGASEQQIVFDKQEITRWTHVQWLS